MKKFFIVLLLLSLTQVEFAHAAETDPSKIQDKDYIFGVSKSSEVNLNQVLYLLAGKDGLPGKDGRDGVDGKDGKDGKDGVQGEKGEPGIADLTYGAGAAVVDGCTRNVTVGFKSKFTGDNFVFDEALLKDVDPLCGDGTKKLAIFIKIAPSGLDNTNPSTYQVDDVVKCVFPIPNSSSWAAAPLPQFTATNADLVCSVPGRPSVANFTLNDIYTADFTHTIGFEFFSDF